MPGDTEREATARLEFTLSGGLSLSGKLARDRPAADEGPEAAWTLLQQVIDHAAYLLDAANSVDTGRQIRDLVLASLLRRAVITAEGVRRCLYHSLEEAGVVLLRTLLEINLNMQLVTADKTDRLSHRLAAYHYLKAKRHVTQVLEHPEIQAGDDEFKSFMKGAGRRQKEFFASPAFDAVREDLARSKHWHGFPSIQAAFESVGGGTDYLQLYDSFSPFAHAGNLDFDWVDIVDSKFHMRPLAQRDPTHIQRYLQGCTLVLLRIMETFLNDKGAAETFDTFTVTFESGETLRITSVAALRHQAIAIFGAATGWSVVSEDDDSLLG